MIRIIETINGRQGRINVDAQVKQGSALCASDTLIALLYMFESTIAHSRQIAHLNFSMFILGLSMSQNELRGVLVYYEQ